MSEHNGQLKRVYDPYEYVSSVIVVCYYKDAVVWLFGNFLKCLTPILLEPHHLKVWSYISEAQDALT